MGEHKFDSPITRNLKNPAAKKDTKAPASNSKKSL